MCVLVSFQRVHASDAICASQTASDWLLALSSICLHSLARMGSQERPCTFSGQRRCLSLGPANVVVCVLLEHWGALGALGVRSSTSRPGPGS